MKLQIQNYTFDSNAKTVTFTDFTSIRLDSILLVTNVTDNIIIYNFADPLAGGTVATNVLTLTYDTSSMDNTDSLQIFYDDGDVQPADVSNQETLNSLVETLNELNTRLTVLASMANSGQPALRTIPIASVSTAVTGTVTATVANATIATIGSGGFATNAINNTLVTLANINNATA
jgi:hypothetical protein